MKMLRGPKAQAKTGNKRSNFYDLISQGLLPPGVSIGGRCKAWPDTELEAVNIARAAGRSDDEIRALVKKIVAERSAPP
jgi:prophage regulatory protein